MKPFYILISLILYINTSYSQDNSCPCDDLTYKYINQKPGNELTQKDIKYINDIEEKCARFILPDYDDSNNWTYLCHVYDLEICFYRKESILISDSIITVWIKEISFVPSEFTYMVEIRHLKYYLKTKENQILSYISLKNDNKVLFVSNTPNEIDKIPQINTYGYLLYESVLNLLTKAK